MPLKLRKRGEIWHYAGTVAGRRLRGSTKTSQRKEAERVANEVESRELQGRRDPGSVLTFAQAAIEYRKVQGEPKYLVLVEDYWRDTLVKDITRGALRRAAVTLLPNAAGAYRNRAVIVPTTAVINFAASLELCPPFRPERFPETKAVREPATWAWVQAFMAHASPEGLADAQRGMPKEFAEGVALIKAYRTLLKKRYGTDKTMMDVLDDGSVLVSVQDLPKRPK